MPVADPGFPIGGRRPVGGRQPPTRTLFDENVCENERNGSCWGARTGGAPLDPPMRANVNLFCHGDNWEFLFSLAVLSCFHTGMRLIHVQLLY